MRALSLIVTGAAALAAVAAFTNRPISPRDGSAVTSALTDRGYESWGRISQQNGNWQVDDAQPRGSGERYRLVLREDTYDVVERTPVLAKGTMRDRSIGG